MTPETIESIKEALIPVAEKIGETAEWGWGVVLKQMYVEATLGLFWAIIGLVLALVAYKVAKGQDDFEDNFLSYLFSVLGILMGVIAFVVGFTIAITHFINPEFYAIQFFLGLVQ